MGRIFGTVVLFYIFVWFGHKGALSLKQLCFISYGGMIRGAIAFGLVLRLPSNLEYRDVLITTSLTLVVGTTIVFGSLMPLVQNYLLPPTRIEDQEDDMDG